MESGFFRPGHVERLKRVTGVLRIGIVVAAALTLAGCVESSFNLADTSRLPRWPILRGVQRSNAVVTLEFASDLGEKKYARLIVRDAHGVVQGTVRGKVDGDIVEFGGVPEEIQLKGPGTQFWVTNDPVTPTPPARVE